MAEVQIKEVRTKTYSIVLSPYEVSRLVKEHIYAKFGENDVDVWDVSRGSDAINLNGWEADEVHASLVQEL